MKAPARISLLLGAISSLLLGLNPEVSADVRYITFKNCTEKTADGLHLEFESPVNINVPTDISVPPGARPGTQPFENDDVEMGGTKYNLSGGIVPNEEAPSGQPRKKGELKIKITSVGDANIILKKWFWTTNTEPIPFPQGTGQTDDGSTKVLASVGGTASGSGRIRVAIGGQQRIFATTQGASPGETLEAFTGFLGEFTSAGTPLIYVASHSPENRLVIAGNILGDPPEELTVEVLARDGGQLLHVAEGLVFQGADSNQDFGIGLNEVTAIAAMWRSGEITDVDSVTRAGYLWRMGEAYVFARGNEGQLQFLPVAELSSVEGPFRFTNYIEDVSADDFHAQFTHTGGSLFDPQMTEGPPGATITIAPDGRQVNIMFPTPVPTGGRIGFTLKSEFSPIEFESGWWTLGGTNIGPAELD